MTSINWTTGIRKIMNEIWKDIKGYEDYYQVSNLGRVRSLPRKIDGRHGPTRLKGQIMTVQKRTGGRGSTYLIVRLSKTGKRNSFHVHRLLYQAFKGPLIKGLVIDHIDNNSLNNSLDNLQQISHRENTIKDNFNKNGYTGVRKSGKKWSAQISINGKKRYLGVADTPREAAKLYKDAKRRAIAAMNKHKKENG